LRIQSILFPIQNPNTYAGGLLAFRLALLNLVAGGKVTAGAFAEKYTATSACAEPSGP
jgi:hypothetical protein